MTTLYLDRKDLELRADGGALALYEGGARSSTVPLALLDRVVIRARTKLDTSVIRKLSEANASLVILDGRNGKGAVTMLGRPHADAARRIEQYRWYLEDARRVQWASRLVCAKLASQARLLTDAVAMRPDARRELVAGGRMLAGALDRLRAAPLDEISLGTVRGIEGAAAAGYFKAFAALFAPALGFSGRNRRPPRDPVNACLSLGYTLAHFEAVSACHVAGLDPLLGLYHEPAFARESLACDFNEPLRPRVDRWVWELFRGRTLRPEHFTLDKGACLLGKIGRKAFYQAYETFAPPVRRYLRRGVGALARGLTDSAAMSGDMLTDHSWEDA